MRSFTQVVRCAFDPLVEGLFYRGSLHLIFPFLPTAEKVETRRLARLEPGASFARRAKVRPLSYSVRAE